MQIAAPAQFETMISQRGIRRSLSVESLAAAIAQMDDAQMRARANRLGDAIRREDGVTAAIEFIEAREFR